MAADGTATASLRALGNKLIQGSPWSVAPIDSSSEGILTWAYADGTILFSDGGSVSVAAGGRVLITVSRGNVHAELVIGTRLQ